MFTSLSNFDSPIDNRKSASPLEILKNKSQNNFDEILFVDDEVEMNETREIIELKKENQLLKQEILELKKTEIKIENIELLKAVESITKENEVIKNQYYNVLNKYEKIIKEKEYMDSIIKSQENLNKEQFKLIENIKNRLKTRELEPNGVIKLIESKENEDMHILILLLYEYISKNDGMNSKNTSIILSENSLSSDSMFEEDIDNIHTECKNKIRNIKRLINEKDDEFKKLYTEYLDCIQINNKLKDSKKKISQENYNLKTQLLNN